MIHLFLGLLLFSFLTTSVLVIPFINLLYRFRFQRRAQKTLDFLNQHTPIFDKFHHQKAGTPVGGGILVILTVGLLYLLIFPLIKLFRVYISFNYPIEAEIQIIFFTFFSFGLLGLYDDIKKFFGIEKNHFFGLKMIHKLLLQVILATIIA